MGGRGSSRGMSDKGKKYGTEYETLYQSGNIKYVKYNGKATTAPMETSKLLVRRTEITYEARFRLVSLLNKTKP